MKTPDILLCLALGIGVATVCGASPPNQVKGSFFRMALAGPFGISNHSLFYLAQDGTCKLLVSKNTFDNNTTYAPSQSGTYVYTPAAGDPSEATLTITLPGASTAYILEFAGDTYGSVTVDLGFSNFSFLLATQNTFLTNVSNRVLLRPTDAAITGFVIEESASRLVLIRTIGPTLAEFGIGPVSAKPNLYLFSGTGIDQVASGQPWGSVTGYDAQAMNWIFGIAGAFQLETGSSDVVYFGILNPGDYTAQASDTTTGVNGGSALTEVYIFPYSGSSSDELLENGIF